MSGFMIKFAVLGFSIFSCALFLVGYFYFWAELFYGDFTLKQMYFHLTSWQTMQFSPFTVLYLVFLVLLGVAYLWLLKHPLWLLKKYMAEPKYKMLQSHKISLNFITSLIVAVIGFALLGSLDNVGKQWRWSKQFVHNLKTTDTIIDENYVDPQNLHFHNETPKNVIIVLAESMERNFTDAQTFGENLLPQLTAQNTLSFAGFQSLCEANWAKSSLIATLCGITEKIYIPPRALSDNIMCVSDVMRQKGYNTYYVQGSSLDFLQTRDFLRAHGFNQTEDIDDLDSDIYSDVYHINFIGKIISDDDLLDYFKVRLRDLAAQKQPFLAMAATMDTHPRDGYLAQGCSRKYGDIRDVVMCADRRLSEFAKWFETQDFADNTVLIILGDHLMIGSDAQPLIKQETQRETLNLVWKQNSTGRIDKPFTQPDWAPTVLDLAGFKWKSHHFGLGISLLSNDLTMLQKYGHNLDERLQRRFVLYDEKIYPKKNNRR